MSETKYFLSVLLIALGVVALSVQSILRFNDMMDISARGGASQIAAARLDVGRLKEALLATPYDPAIALRKADLLAAHLGTIAAMQRAAAFNDDASEPLTQIYAASERIAAQIDKASSSAASARETVFPAAATLDRALSRLEAIAVRVETGARASLARRAQHFAWASLAALVAVGVFAFLLINRRQAAARALERRNIELKAAHALVDHEARHDALTGLPNRRLLQEKLSDWSSDPLTAIVVDLDHFKHVNDARGHAIGDAVLQRTAQILAEQTRDAPHESFVARIGGDEFVILQRRVAEEQQIHALTRRVSTAMAGVDLIGGRPCRIAASFGAATSDGDAEHIDRALINADLALKQSKRVGRGRCHILSAQDTASIRSRNALADELSVALEKGDIEPFYQAQFDARTLDLVGVEALARWRHPTRGVLTPYHFLEAAEEFGLVAEIDSAILHRAASDLERFAEAGFDAPRISVNVSARRLADETLLDDVHALALRPGSIAFELLETVFLDDRSDKLTENIRSIRASGIAIEVDDFGTGHASIVGLLNLAPDRLKIDRRFIAPILEDRRAEKLLASMIEIGEALDIRVVAEGVETREHVEKLRALGCDILQGYALSRPAPFEDVAEQIRTEAWRAAS